MYTMPQQEELVQYLDLSALEEELRMMELEASLFVEH